MPSGPRVSMTDSSERRLSTPNWRLHLAQRLRFRAHQQPGLSETQRQELHRVAGNGEALHRHLKKLGRLIRKPKPK